MVGECDHSAPTHATCGGGTACGHHYAMSGQAGGEITHTTHAVIKYFSLNNFSVGHRQITVNESFSSTLTPPKKNQYKGLLPLILHTICTFPLHNHCIYPCCCCCCCCCPADVDVPGSELTGGLGTRLDRLPHSSYSDPAQILLQAEYGSGKKVEMT